MKKLSMDVQYITQMNMLGKHLKMTYKLSDAELQKLKHEIHKLIEKAVE